MKTLSLSLPCRMTGGSALIDDPGSSGYKCLIALIYFVLDKEVWNL